MLASHSNLAIVLHASEKPKGSFVTLDISAHIVQKKIRALERTKNKQGFLCKHVSISFFSLDKVHSLGGYFDCSSGLHHLNPSRVIVEARPFSLKYGAAPNLDSVGSQGFGDSVDLPPAMELCRVTWSLLPWQRQAAKCFGDHKAERY